MLPANDTTKLQEWNSRQTDSVSIRFFPTSDQRSATFDNFLQDLRQAASRIVVQKGEKAAEDIPEIRLGQGISYHLLPRGAELPPFLEILELLRDPASAAASLQPHLPPGDAERISAFRLPAAVALFVAPDCLFCPDTVRRVLPLHLLNPLVQVRIYDCVMFPEISAQHSIKAVPTVVVNQKIRFSGAFPLSELVRAVMDQDPAALGASALETMLAEGQAPRLGQLMLEHRQVFPALADLMTHPRWPVRLGAMVALEEVIASAPPLLSPLLDILWQRFDSSDDAAKGDILYVMGEAGAREHASRIRTIADGSYGEEVRDAAREALQKLE